jgi:LytS/YehU family sensor histidine kinase
MTMSVSNVLPRDAVPSLILMPLVENSVTHGLRGGIRADPGRYEAQISLPIRDLPPIHFRDQPPCAS